MCPLRSMRGKETRPCTDSCDHGASNAIGETPFGPSPYPQICDSTLAVDCDHYRTSSNRASQGVACSLSPVVQRAQLRLELELKLKPGGFRDWMQLPSRLSYRLPSRHSPNHSPRSVASSRTVSRVPHSSSSLPLRHLSSDFQGAGSRSFRARRLATVRPPSHSSRSSNAAKTTALRRTVVVVLVLY